MPRLKRGYVDKEIVEGIFLKPIAPIDLATIILLASSKIKTNLVSTSNLLADCIKQLKGQEFTEANGYNNETKMMFDEILSFLIDFNENFQDDAEQVKDLFTGFADYIGRRFTINAPQF